jgi:hypothetical protein
MSTLQDFWPEPTSVNQVLRGDAESHLAEVALAVHQPMRLLRRSYLDVGRTGAEAVDEGRLLDDLLSPARDGAKLILIEGDAGTGKSHAVRWLELQLRGRPDASRRVVILIRKGTSLRAIVEELLQLPALAGVEGEGLTARLARAREPIVPERAAGTLCEELAAVCETLQKRAVDKRRSGKAMSPEDELDEGWGGLLPYLFRSHGFRSNLAAGQGPVLRLVRHLGESTLAPPEGREHSFVVEDLLVANIPDELGAQEKKVLWKLGRESARRDAVSVLNRALDEAKRLLLGLDSTIIADVFREIRRRLFHQDSRKEMFLLVEDFADLSGVQGQLMQASIQQGFDAEGCPELCTLRTVLAYTPGYLQKETVLSRAGQVYEIPSSDDSVVEVRRRAANLIAAYLNAARLGIDRLGRAFQVRNSTQGDWLPELGPLEGDDEQVLAAFGRANGIPLFPFNQHTIDALIDETCRKGDQLLFNPRSIINQVMPRVLDHRSTFVDGHFPDSTFATSVRRELGRTSTWFLQQGLQGPERDRLERILLYWGTVGFPYVALAFRLPPLRGTPEQPNLTVDVVPTPRDSVVVPSSSIPGSPLRELARWRAIFDDWSKGGAPLKSPADRRALRDAVDTALRPALARDWQIAHEFKEADFKKGRLFGWREWIQVAGVDADDATPLGFALVIATQQDREDSTRKSLIAEELALVASVAATKRNDWDFDGAEDVLVKFGGFVERHRPAAAALLDRYWRGRVWDPVPWLADQLERTGFALGIADADASDVAKRISALFERPTAVAPTGGSEWRDQALAAIHAVRTTQPELISWIDVLSDELGAYQGSSGGSAHAIDVARLQPRFPSRGKKGGPPAVGPPDFPHGAAEVPVIKTLLLGKAALKNLAAVAGRELARRQKLATRLREWLGSASRAEGLVQELRAMKAALLDVQVMTAAQGTVLDDELELLGNLPLGRALPSAERLPAPDASERDVLTALARNQVHADEIDRATTLLDRIVSGIDQFERELSGRVSAADPFDEALIPHRCVLTQLVGLISNTGLQS